MCYADLLDYVAAMQTIVNKTFKEIAVGDTASVQRTLQAGDVRAWAAAFGEVDMLAGPGESQGAAGIVTAILTALVGSALPGPGTSIRTTSVQINGALPIGARDDGAARRAGEAVGSGDRRAGRPVHRPGRSGFRHRDAGSPGADDAAATRGGGASARWAGRALPKISSRC